VWYAYRMMMYIFLINWTWGFHHLLWWVQAMHYIKNEGRWQLFKLASSLEEGNISFIFSREQRRGTKRSRSRGRHGLLCVYNYAPDTEASEEYNMRGMLRRSKEHNQHDEQCRKWESKSHSAQSKSKHFSTFTKKFE